MSEKQDSVQRIQVGVMGLAAVLLVVSLANLVIDKTSEEVSAMQAENGAEAGSAALAEDGQKSEPLAEMGLTPAPAETEGGTQAAPGNKPVQQSGPTAGGGQIVPDLKPDPKLESRMDREP